MYIMYTINGSISLLYVPASCAALCSGGAVGGNLRSAARLRCVSSAWTWMYLGGQCSDLGGNI